MEIAMRQITFAYQASFEKFARAGRRAQFLDTMETIVPWSELEALIAPYYPKAGNGRQPVGLSIMLRIYFFQHWFNLSDPAPKMRSTIRPRCAALLALTLAAPLRSTKARF
jgi:IS5 family transposase